MRTFVSIIFVLSVYFLLNLSFHRKDFLRTSKEHTLVYKRKKILLCVCLSVEGYDEKDRSRQLDEMLGFILLLLNVSFGAQ